MNHRIYGFIGRGLLTEAALNRTQRAHRASPGGFDPESEKRLSVDLLDQDLVGNARRMASVYTVVAAFENSARQLVSETLAEKKGENWWQDCVSDKIRKKAQSRLEEEKKVRWHTQRGTESVNFTDFGDLANIVTQNWTLFSDLLLDQAWVTHIFDTLERSRNVIMHSGELDPEDLARIGVLVRDWVKQIPA